ncbi:MAG TPA: hypothetical protein VIU93_03170 [Gallionellaceae bacterium]
MKMAAASAYTPTITGRKITQVTTTSKAKIGSKPRISEQTTRSITIFLVWFIYLSVKRASRQAE